MIVKNAKHEITAVKPNQYPASSLPEIAMAGRSNVGKSSFINTILNRKSLARVGATPGKTRELNFYNVDDVFYFVDMPGYGYAGVSKEKKSSWSEVVETYLSSRPQLQLVLLLVDIRHKPSEDDKMMHQWLVSNHVPYLVVATKVDKIPRSQIQLKIKEIKQVLDIPEGSKVIPFSSESKQGKDEVWAALDELINSAGGNKQVLRG